MQSLSWRRRLAAFLLLPVVLVMAGCGRFTAEFDIKDADSMDVSMDIGIDKTLAGMQFSSADEMCQDLMSEVGEFDAPTPEAYEEDDLFGCTISGGVTREQFGDEMELTESGDELHLVMAGDPSISTDEFDEYPAFEDFEFEMVFNFPGTVNSSSVGEISGTTVTITDINELASDIDITAEASGGFPTWAIVLIVVAVLGILLLIGIALIVFFVVRGRTKNATSSTPGGYGAPNAPGGPGSPGAPGGYGAAAAGDFAAGAPAGSPQSAPESSQWGQSPQQQAPPAPGFASPQSAPGAPQGGPAPQQGQQWGQPPQQGQQWGQPPQQGQQWGQPPQQGQPGSDQPWAPPQQQDQEGQTPPPWSQPPQG